MRRACVILNYNDADRTCAQAERIRAYAALDAVVIVDNASTDDSAARFRALLGVQEMERVDGVWREKRNTPEAVACSDDEAGAVDKCAQAEPVDKRTFCGHVDKSAPEQKPVYLLVADVNRGYGAGNNLGAAFAMEALGAEQFVIANPDTCFDERCIRTMARVFARHADVGAVSVQMHDSQNGLQQTAWPLRGFWGELANSGPLLRRLFRTKINYPKTYFAGRRAVAVGALHGSMLMLSAKAFLAAGGYDEQVFLYCEENILGQRLKNAGYRSVLVLGEQYEHENSGSISKTYQSMLPKQRLRQQSEYYYYVHYLHIGKGKRLLTKVFHRLVRLEVYVAERLGVLK